MDPEIITEYVYVIDPDLREKLDQLIFNSEVLHNDLVMLASGLKFLMYIASAFLLWQICKILWGLFYKWFFGGV